MILLCWPAPQHSLTPGDKMGVCASPLLSRAKERSGAHRTRSSYVAVLNNRNLSSSSHLPASVLALIDHFYVPMSFLLPEKERG